MNKPAFTVTIPEPCHENWNKMTPREQGRFCAVCTKTVVDFSVMSDAELFDTLKNGSGNMCGHFHKEQLDRSIAAPKKPKWILQPFWKYFLGVLMLFKMPSAKAQTKGKVVCTPNPTPPTNVKMGIVAVVPPTQKTEKEITGTITDNEGHALSGVVVNVKGTTKYTTSDSKGNFKIKAFPGEQLEITDLEYQTAVYRIGQENHAAIKLEKPERRIMYMGEPAVIEVVPAEVVIEVTDKLTGQAIKNATIKWTEENNGTAHVLTTNKKGAAKTTISLSRQKMAFTVQATGYLMTVIELPATELAGKKTTVLKALLEKEPEVVVVGMIKARPVGQEEEEEQPQPAPVKQQVITVQKQLSVYPNPAKRSGRLTLNFSNEEAETCMVQLTDLNGQIIMNRRIDAVKGANQVDVPLADNMSAGTYMLNLMNSRGQWVAKEKVVVN